MPTIQERPFVDTLNSYLKRLNVKSAADGGSGSTHPSEDVEDQTRPATEGARAAEHTKDIKDTIPAGGVDAASENSGGKDDNMIHVGMNPTRTGDDPAVEDNYKDRADDSGSTHPATTSVGPKYSSLKVAELKSQFSKLANEVLAGIVVESNKSASQNTNQPASNTTKQAQPTTPAKTETQADAAAGYQLAEKVAEFDKFAQDVIENTIRDAIVDADAVGTHLVNRFRLKKSMDDEASEGEDHKSPPSEGGAPEGGAMPPGLEGLMAGGAGDAGGAPAGALPPDAQAAGGGGGEEDALQQLMMALEELGITPQELAQAMAAGPAGGSADMGGGGMPPPGAAPAEMPPEMPPAEAGAKLAAAAKSFQRSGKYERRLPKNAAERQQINCIKDYVRELISR